MFQKCFVSANTIMSHKFEAYMDDAFRHLFKICSIILLVSFLSKFGFRINYVIAKCIARIESLLNIPMTITSSPYTLYVKRKKHMENL